VVNGQSLKLFDGYLLNLCPLVPEKRGEGHGGWSSEIFFDPFFDPLWERLAGETDDRPFPLSH